MILLGLPKTELEFPGLVRPPSLNLGRQMMVRAVFLAMLSEEKPSFFIDYSRFDKPLTLHRHCILFYPFKSSFAYYNSQR